MIDHFIPSQGREEEIPLERYLDPMPRNVVSRYIEAYSHPGDMILDPFCQTAVVIEEAVRKMVATKEAYMPYRRNVVKYSKIFRSFCAAYGILDDHKVFDAANWSGEIKR